MLRSILDYVNAYYCMLFRDRVRVRFNVWLVTGYAQNAFILSVVIVRNPLVFHVKRQDSAVRVQWYIVVFSLFLILHSEYPGIS